MDLRGIAQFENGKCFIVGGMETGQQVSSKTWELTLENTSSISEQISDKHEIQLFPNPTQGDVHFIWPSHSPEIETITCELYSHLGQLIDVFDVTRHNPYYSFENLPSGMYIIRFLSTKHFKNMPFIIID